MVIEYILLYLLSAFYVVLPALLFIWVCLLEIIPLLLAIAVLTLIERRTMGSIQRRRGPNQVGGVGILQPIADGLKLVLKELFSTTDSNAGLFFIAPIFTLFFTLFFWCMVPGSQNFALLELQYVLLFFLIIGTFNVKAIILAGWSSNSKYAFLGGIRAASQMISYEICMGTVVASIVLFSGSFSLVEIVNKQIDVWYIVPLFPFWVLFVITSLAETNRTPFDLVEAEAELVAGYNVEYPSILFAMLFIAEYGNILVMSVLSTIFFFGGWLVPFTTSFFFFNSWFFCGFFFSFKVACNVFLFILVRATLPRYRYDQLMSLGWKILLPLSISLLVLQLSVQLLFGIYFP